MLLWGPEAQGDFTRWHQLGGLRTFVALHGAFKLISFMLRQLELARSVQLHPYMQSLEGLAISGDFQLFLQSRPLPPNMRHISDLQEKKVQIFSRLFKLPLQ